MPVFGDVKNTITVMTYVALALPLVIFGDYREKPPFFFWFCALRIAALAVRKSAAA